MAVQHRQQHGQPVALQADRQAPRRRAAAVHQRLDLHQHRARALERDHHAAAGHGLGMLRQKDGARVGYALEAFFRHGEDADLVDGAEAVLDGADQAKAGVRVAFEIQHRVHHVLQHARTGQRALFRHMADQHDGGAAGLGGTCEMRGALAHLRHRARRRGQLLRIHRLDGVDHRDGRLVRRQRGEDFFQLDLGQHLHLRAVQPQAPCTQCDLGAAFLARHVEGFLAGALQRIERLQQQRGLADTGIAADQHHAAFDDATAQHAVQFVLAGRRAVHVGGFDVGQRGDLRGLRQGGKAVLGRGGTLGHGFDQRVPGIAVRALAQPLGAGAAALVAGVDGFVLGHGPNNTGCPYSSGKSPAQMTVGSRSFYLTC